MIQASSHVGSARIRESGPSKGQFVQEFSHSLYELAEKRFSPNLDLNPTWRWLDRLG